MKPLRSAVAEYTFHRKSRGLAENTLIGDQKTLSFLLELYPSLSVEEVTSTHIDRYFTERATTHSNASMNKDLSRLKTFFHYAVKDASPIKDRPLFSEEQKLRSVVDRQDWPHVLDVAGKDHLVIRAAMALGFYLALRPSEVRGLRIGDLDLVNLQVNVPRIKQKKREWMPMTTELADEMARWLRYYRAQVGMMNLNPDWYLIPSYRGTAKLMGLLPRREFSMISRAMRRVLETAGFEDDRIGGHTLRRSSGTALYEALRARGHDGSVRAAQTLLGHSSPVSTERYLSRGREKKELVHLMKGQEFPR